MNKAIFALLLALLVFPSISTSAQNGIKVNPIDPAVLQNKVLYIPAYDDVNPMYSKRRKAQITAERISDDAILSQWDRVMMNSTWKHTNYEVKKFTPKELIKEKNPEALMFVILETSSSCGESGIRMINYYAKVIMTGPKKKELASALVNGLDWNTDEGLRLVVNMMSDAISNGIETFEAKKGGVKASTRDEFKKDLVNFVDEMERKIFLVEKLAVSEEVFQQIISNPELDKQEVKRLTKEQKKNIEKDEALAKALAASWTLCEYKIVEREEVNALRKAADADSFYWKNVELNTCGPLIGQNTNYLFSTNGDKVLAMFAGKGAMKGSTIKAIQDELQMKYERYKKQLKKSH